MAVYDDQNTSLKTGADDDELRRITGINPADEKAMEARAADQATAVDNERTSLDRSGGPGEEANLKEGSKDKDSGKDLGDNNSNKQNSGIPYRKEASKSLPSRVKGSLLNKKTAIIAGITGTIISGVVAIFIAMPGIIINNVHSLLTEKLPGLQHSHQMRYKRSKFARISDMFSRNGRLGGKVIADMERLGYRFSWDPNNRNLIRGVTLPNGTTSIPNANGALEQHIEAFLDKRRPLISTKAWKTKRMEAFYSRYGITRKSVVRASPSDLELPGNTVRRNQAVSIYRGETAEAARLNVEPAQITEGMDEAEVNRLEAVNSRLEANRAMIEEGGEFSEIVDNLIATGDPDLLDDELKELAQHAPLIDVPVTENVHNYANKVARSGSAAGRVFNSVKGLFSVTDLPDKMCIANKRLEKAQAAARWLRALSLMRYAGDIIKIAEDMRLGKADSKLLAEMGKKFTSTDSYGNPVGGSPSYGYMVRGLFSKSRNRTVSDPYRVDGELGGVYGGIKDTVDIPGCSVWQNPVFQVGAEVGMAIASFFTGGGATAFSTGAKTAAQAGVKNMLVNTVRSVFKKQVLKQIGKGAMRMVAVSAATEITFEGIITLTQMKAEKSMGFNVTTDEAGAEMLSMATSGKEVMDTRRYSAAGQIPATVENYELALADYKAEQLLESSEQSLYARVFDIYNPQSFASSLLFRLPASFTNLGYSLQEGIANFIDIPGSILNGFASLFGGSALANDDMVAYDTYELKGGGINKGVVLATGVSGSPKTIMPDDILSIDPVENLEFLSSHKGSDGQPYISSNDVTTAQPYSKDMKDHIDNCINDIDVFTVIETSNLDAEDLTKDETSYNPRYDCLARYRITKRVKAYLAFIDLYDMYESDFYPEEITTYGGSSGGNIDCSGAIGNEKIVCAAQNYMGIPYSNNGSPALNGGADAESWLSRNPSKDSRNSSGIDCSGFTNLALYEAFKYKTTAGCSGGYVSGNDPNIEEISLDELRPGDFLTVSRSCNTDSVSGHIGIFVRREADGSIVTIESAGGRNIDGERVSGFYRKDASSLGDYWKYAARYVGPGSNP